MIFLPLGTEQKPKRIPYVTLGLIAVNTLVYFYLNSLDPKALAQAYDLYTWQILDGNLTQLITALFFHHSAFHLLANMIYLWTFGAYLETVVGARKYLFYYLAGGIAGSSFCEVIILCFMPQYRGGYGFGASGAVSALMGVCLVRCYYNKIRLGVDPLGLFTFIPKRIAVPASLFIGYSMLLDWHSCTRSFSDTRPWLGCWAHFGGYLFGMIVSYWWKEYGRAQLDHFRLRARYWMRKGMALDQVREDLETVIRRDPTDAWAMVDLARVETQYEQGRKGVDLYRGAVRSLWKQGQRSHAAHIFAEFSKKYAEVSFGLLPFGICRELIKIKEYEVAARALKGFIRERKSLGNPSDDLVLEQAYLELGRLLGERLGCAEGAGLVYGKFLQRFPWSRQRRAVLQKLELLAPVAA